jgi:hypothetical protein
MTRQTITPTLLLYLARVRLGTRAPGMREINLKDDTCLSGSRRSKDPWPTVRHRDQGSDCAAIESFGVELPIAGRRPRKRVDRKRS